MAVAFPERWEAKGNISLKAERDAAKTKVNYERHNDQITALENRDLYLLDFLSKFDALPIGAIMPTSIPYTSETMPDGWIWANGGVYLKEGNTSDARPNLWNAVKNIPGAVIPLSGDPNGNDYQHLFHNDHPDGFTPCGKYVDAGNNQFYVPTLNNVFLMSITSANATRESGKYEPESIAEHTHDIVAYPVNGANLSSTADKIGVALTDQINDDFTSVKTGNYSTKHRYTSQTNNGSGSETKPESVAYQFMIKADFTSFDLANTVDTDCDSVHGYKPSPTPPDSPTDLMWFPVPNEDLNGKLDPNWFDMSELARRVTGASTEFIEEIISRSAVLSSETSVEPAANSIPRASETGKIDPSYLSIANNADIESLF